MESLQSLSPPSLLFNLNDTEGMSKKALHSKKFLYESLFCVNFVEFAQKSGAEHGYDTVVVFCDVSRRFAVMSFGLMLFVLCSVLHKVSSVPQNTANLINV